jgi:hypothetical protein
LSFRSKYAMKTIICTQHNYIRFKSGVLQEESVIRDTSHILVSGITYFSSKNFFAVYIDNYHFSSYAKYVYLQVLLEISGDVVNISTREKVR